MQRFARSQILQAFPKRNSHFNISSIPVQVDVAGAVLDSKIVGLKEAIDSEVLSVRGQDRRKDECTNKEDYTFAHTLRA